MTKAQVLDYIAGINWEQDSWKKSPEQKKIEQAVAKYVVYKQDPDTYSTYGHEYHMTKENALADFESRTTNDYLCYCFIAELDGDWQQQRRLGRRVEPWE